MYERAVSVTQSWVVFSEILNCIFVRLDSIQGRQELRVRNRWVANVSGSKS